MARFVLLFYAILSILALCLIQWRMDSAFLFHPLSLPASGILLPAASSIILVILVHLLSLAALDRWQALKECAKDMRSILGGLSKGEIFMIAVSSGIGEELFFRGWLLNETGLIVSSLIFGIVHFPPNRNWFYWPLFASAMGFLLGSLCLWTDTLIYAIVVHAGVNFFNILKLPERG